MVIVGWGRMGSTHGGHAYLSQPSVSIDAQLHYHNVPGRPSRRVISNGCRRPATFLRTRDPRVGS